jgi:hypothetical protein
MQLLLLRHCTQLPSGEQYRFWVPVHIASVVHWTHLWVDVLHVRPFVQFASPSHCTQWPIPVSQYGVGCEHTASLVQAGPTPLPLFVLSTDVPSCVALFLLLHAMDKQMTKKAIPVCLIHPLSLRGGRPVSSRCHVGARCPRQTGTMEDGRIP